jgi:hypothetical protein
MVVSKIVSPSNGQPHHPNQTESNNAAASSVSGRMHYKSQLARVAADML